MRSLNARVLSLKEEILKEIAKGYKPTEVGRVLQIDSRTIKRAIEIWRKEDSELAKAEEAVKAAKKALEDATKLLETSLHK